MDGENHGSKPYEQMDDLGVPLFMETPLYTHETRILIYPKWMIYKGKPY